MRRLPFPSSAPPYALAAAFLALATVLACDDSDSSGGGGATSGPDGGNVNNGSSGTAPKVALGPEAGLYVTDYAGALFHLNLEDGSVVAKHGSPGSGMNQYQRPMGIAATKKHLYVADQDNHRLVRLTVASGAGWETLDLGAEATPYGVAALLSEDEKEETVVFSDYDAMQFFTVAGDFDAAPTAGAKLKYNACSVALRAGESVGSTGCSSGPALNLIVSTQSGDRVYPPTDGTGELRRPDGLAYLPDGTLVIADTGNFRVLCAKGPSAKNDFGKQGSDGDLDFLAISAITTDTRGRIFVADTSRKRIVRVDDCLGSNPKVFDTKDISQVTGMAAVGPNLL